MNSLKAVGGAANSLRHQKENTSEEIKSVNSENESTLSVSVVIPVKNGARTIPELLESLTQIDYEEDKTQVIVVDGNSTDNTREIVSRFAVTLLKEERPGLNAARNTGIKHSQGEIIAFTDCDCVVPNDWIKRTAENFHDSQVGCVGGNILGYHNNFLSKYCDRSIMPVMRIFKKREILHEVKPPLQYPAGCNMAIRREVLDEVGLFDENIKYGFDEDELVERICRKGYTMVLDPRVSVKHKHRLTLSELLKQTFQYGRGGGLLSRMKGTGSAFSKWILLCILGSIIVALMILSLVLFTVFTGSIMSLATLLILLLLPPTGLMIFYIHQTYKEEDKKYRKILAYPFIDIMRSITFIAGAIYQILRPQDKIKQ